MFELQTTATTPKHFRKCSIQYSKYATASYFQAMRDFLKMFCRLTFCECAVMRFIHAQQNAIICN